MLCGVIMLQAEMITRSMVSKFLFSFSGLCFLVCNSLLVSELIRYSGLCRMAQKLVSILKQMDPSDPFRIKMSDELLEKLLVLLPPSVLFSIPINFSLWRMGKWIKCQVFEDD